MIEKGRTATHALARLWEVEHLDRVVAPAPAENHGGFSPKDLSWILTHAPAEMLILRPARAAMDGMYAKVLVGRPLDAPR